MAVYLLFYFFVILATSFASSPKQEFDFQVFPDGSYSIGFRFNWLTTEYWLNSGPLMVMYGDKTYSSQDGTLTVKSFREFANTKLGPVAQYFWTWQTPNDELEVSTSIEVHFQPPQIPNTGHQWWYHSSNNPIILFGLSFPSQLNNTKGSRDGIQASYPSFILADSQNTRGWMTYSGGSECVLQRKLTHPIILTCDNFVIP